MLNTRYFRKEKKLACLRDIKKFLSGSAKDQDVRADIAKAFDDDDSTALLLNDRFLNVPPEVSPPLVSDCLRGQWFP